MSMKRKTIILGSQSPQRLELLRQVVCPERTVVMPPRSTSEAGFEGLGDWLAIEQRLLQIAGDKCDDVRAQLADPRCPIQSADIGAIVAADTVIVGEADNGRLEVLGKPPDDDTWPDVVRQWFRDYYIGKTHEAATALLVADVQGERLARVVRSKVAFRADGDQWFDWYVATGEPRNKAGGYAIQGAGSIFVERVEGSLSNVVGLPLVELMELLRARNLDLLRQRGAGMCR